MIDWCDIIFVMERKHLAILMERFDLSIRSKTCVLLDIPDDYHFNDPELIALLKGKLANYL